MPVRPGPRPDYRCRDARGKGGRRFGGAAPWRPRPGSVAGTADWRSVAADGQVFLVTDNDGVDDAPGETQLQNLGTADDVFGP